MKVCVCGDQAAYFCKLHQNAVCKKHRALHEEGKQREHIYETLGKKFSAQELVKIVENLLSKIEIADRCADQILEESKRIVDTITKSCKQL